MSATSPTHPLPLQGGATNFFRDIERNMSTKPDLIEELRALLTQHDKLTDTMKNSRMAPIFLDRNVCPPGLAPCDPTTQKCPDDDEAFAPPTYMNDGTRCYTAANVEFLRRTHPDEIQIDIREFVTRAAELNTKLRKKLEGIRKDETPCNLLNSRTLCGARPDACSWNTESKECTDKVTT